MGGKQLGFSDYELTTAKKQTKREKFLSEMEVVAWGYPDSVDRCQGSTGLSVRVLMNCCS
jgi:hypothetical protein